MGSGSSTWTCHPHSMSPLGAGLLSQLWGVREEQAPDKTGRHSCSWT